MLPIKLKYYAIGITILLGVAVSCIATYKYVQLQSENSTLELSNTKLINDNAALTTNLANEKRLREDTEKVLSHFKDLKNDNKETERTNTVIVEKIKQIDIKSVKADTINTLVSELEGDWKCINGCQ